MTHNLNGEVLHPREAAESSVGTEGSACSCSAKHTDTFAACILLATSPSDRNSRHPVISGHMQFAPSAGVVPDPVVVSKRKAAQSDVPPALCRCKTRTGEGSAMRGAVAAVGGDAPWRIAPGVCVGRPTASAWPKGWPIDTLRVCCCVCRASALDRAAARLRRRGRSRLPRRHGDDRRAARAPLPGHRQGPKVVLELLILLYHFDYAIHLFGQFCVALLRLLLHEALEGPEPELGDLALLADLLLQPREKLRLQHHCDEPLPRIKSIKCKVADYSENASQLVLVRCSRARGSQNQVHQ